MGKPAEMVKAAYFGQICPHGVGRSANPGRFVNQLDLDKSEYNI